MSGGAQRAAPGDRDRERGRRGFTLIELMIVVAITGILAALAVPAFMKYLQKSKQVEAREHLEKIYSAARLYFAEPYTPPGQIQPVTAQFPITEAATPAITCCTPPNAGRCEPNRALWLTPTWQALVFSVVDPHYYQYEFVSTGASTAATFTATAYGDLDCDGLVSTFSMQGVVDSSGEVRGTAALYRNKELE